MNKKFTIKRKKRFFENILLDSYTGIIFVSSFLPKEINPSKPIRINITNFYFYKNNFCLLDKYFPPNELKKQLETNYGLKKKQIVSIDTIYSNAQQKIIYLIYLSYDTEINNFTKHKTLNLFRKCYYKNKDTQDLYQAIYKMNKKSNSKKCKIYYDNKNYVEISINDIFYYLIGNSEINK